MSLLDNETQVSVFVEGLDHAEGIAWGLDGYAYAGGEAGQLYRIDIGKQEVVQFADTGGFVLGMAIDAHNNIYACDAGNKAVMKITQGGTVSVYSSGTEDEPFRVPNYPAFDADGNLYVCDSGDWHADNGMIYRIKPGGEAEVWDRRAKEFPNGLCMGPDGEGIYVAMSVNPPRVDRIRIEEDGSPGRIETVAEFPRTVPDGVAFDVDGNLYVSMYRPDVIYRRTPDGQYRHPCRGLRGNADRGTHQHRLLWTQPRRAPQHKPRQVAHHPIRCGCRRPSPELPGHRLGAVELRGSRSESAAQISP